MPQSTCLDHSGIRAKIVALENHRDRTDKRIDVVKGEFQVSLDALKQSVEKNNTMIIRIMIGLAVFTGGASGLSVLF